MGLKLGMAQAGLVFGALTLAGCSSPAAQQPQDEITTVYATPVEQSALWDAHHPKGQAVEVQFPNRDKPSTLILSDGHAYLGDDIVGDVQGETVVGLTGQVMLRLDGRQGLYPLSSGITDAGLKWPGGVIPYVFDSSAPTNLRNQFTQAVGIYNSKTVVRYVARSNQPNYVRVVSGSGCSSYVGMMSKNFKPNGQELTLGSNGCGVGAALHEMGHAAGLHHEQARQDRDQYVSINYDLIAPDWRSQYDIIKSDKTNTAFTPYDFNSIMHYGNSQKNGQWVMTDKSGKVAPRDIGSKGSLTASDIKAFQTIYGGSGGGGGVTPPPPATTTFRSTALTPRANKCLDVPGGQTTNGLRLQQWDCSGVSNQTFDFKAVAGRADTYTVASVASGKCLDASGALTANNTKIIQFECQNSANQQWTLRTVSASAKEYQLVGVQSGRCLDVTGAAQTAGAQLILWDCHAGANIAKYGNQTWRLSGKP